MWPRRSRSRTISLDSHRASNQCNTTNPIPELIVHTIRLSVLGVTTDTVSKSASHSLAIDSQGDSPMHPASNSIEIPIHHDANRGECQPNCQQIRRIKVCSRSANAVTDTVTVVSFFTVESVAMGLRFVGRISTELKFNLVVAVDIRK